MSVFNKQPRTVAQITENLQKMVDELSVSEAQYEELQRQNVVEIAKREAANQDIEVEMKRNRSVSSKLAALFGDDE